MKIIISENQFKVLSETITLDINVGDTLMGGRFKNKKIIVKTIGKNDNGEITINGKPLLKYRLVKESKVLTENITKKELIEFFNEFLFFLSMNLMKVSSYSKGIEEQEKLREMMLVIQNRKIINGMTIFEVLGHTNLNNVIEKPKLLSVVLFQVKNYIEYIEPRIKLYVDNNPIKEKWLEKIDNFKKVYIRIIT